MTSHRFHRLLQIRRYVYHEVVRLEDLENLIDCSNIQVVILQETCFIFIFYLLFDNYGVRASLYVPRLILWGTFYLPTSASIR